MQHSGCKLFSLVITGLIKLTMTHNNQYNDIDTNGYTEPLVSNNTNNNATTYRYHNIRSSVLSKLGITNVLLGTKLNFSINLALYYAICANKYDIVSVFSDNIIFDSTNNQQLNVFGVTATIDLLIVSILIILLGQLIGSLPMWLAVKLGKNTPVDNIYVKQHKLIYYIIGTHWPSQRHYIAHVIRSTLLALQCGLTMYSIILLILYISCSTMNNSIIHNINNTDDTQHCYMSSSTYTVIRAIYCGALSSLTGSICYIATLNSNTMPEWALNGWHNKQKLIQSHNNNVIDSEIQNNHDV